VKRSPFQNRLTLKEAIRFTSQLSEGVLYNSIEYYQSNAIQCTTQLIIQIYT